MVILVVFMRMLRKIIEVVGGEFLLGDVFSLR